MIVSLARIWNNNTALLNMEYIRMLSNDSIYLLSSVSIYTKQNPKLVYIFCKHLSYMTLKKRQCMATWQRSGSFSSTTINSPPESSVERQYNSTTRHANIATT